MARYIHNAYGERSIKVKQDGSISTFLYNDQGQLIEEIQYNARHQKQKETYWVWLDTLPIAQIDIPFTNNVAGQETISYLHSDHLNTPRWASNTSKQTVWSWQSDAYGTTMANEDPRSTGTKTTIPLRFPGQYFDEETGFHYNYFRTYIPDLGRYSQSDPIGLAAGWNTFVYVEGNPVNFVDPYGLKSPSAPADGKAAWCIKEIFGVDLNVIRSINVQHRSKFSSLFASDTTTTRKGEINLPPSMSKDKFFSNAYLVTHEYYHVIKQWPSGDLTVSKYLLEMLITGSSTAPDNKYENEADLFAKEHMFEYLECMKCSDWTEIYR